MGVHKGGKLRWHLCVVVPLSIQFLLSGADLLLLTMISRLFCSPPALLLGHPLIPVPWTLHCRTNLENTVIDFPAQRMSGHACWCQKLGLSSQGGKVKKGVRNCLPLAAPTGYYCHRGIGILDTQSIVPKSARHCYGQSPRLACCIQSSASGQLSES